MASIEIYAVSKIYICDTNLVSTFSAVKWVVEIKIEPRIKKSKKQNKTSVNGAVVKLNSIEKYGN